MIRELLDVWGGRLEIEAYYSQKEGLVDAISLVSSNIESSRLVSIFGHDLFAVEFLEELVKVTNSYIAYGESELRAVNLERNLISAIDDTSLEDSIKLENKLSVEYIFPRFAWHLIHLREFYLKNLLKHNISRTANISKWAIIEGSVFIDDGARIMRNAIISGPAYIGPNTIVGDHTLVRESVIENNSVIGCFMEIARSYAQSHLETHSGYLGDSILDSRVHLGAGFVSANLRLDRGEIRVKLDQRKINTGLRKLGAIIGEGTEVGINVSVMPGKMIGKNVRIWPGSVVFRNVEDNTDYIPTIEYVTRKRKLEK